MYIYIYIYMCVCVCVCVCVLQRRERYHGKTAIVTIDMLNKRNYSQAGTLCRMKTRY